MSKSNQTGAFGDARLDSITDPALPTDTFAELGRPALTVAAVATMRFPLGKPAKLIAAVPIVAATACDSMALTALTLCRSNGSIASVFSFLHAVSNLRSPLFRAEA